MLDLHALYDGTGSTSLVAYTGIPANDGAVVAGVPIVSGDGRARLVAWGGLGIDSSKGIKSAALVSLDQMDPINNSQYVPGGTSTAPYSTPHMMESLVYRSSARTVKVAQKAAGLVMTFTIDHYNPGDVRALGVVQGSYLPQSRGMYSKAFGGALTAQAWGTVGFTTTNNIPAGKFAILGAWVSNITNVMLLRFSHADFGAAKPGFMAADLFTKAPTIDLLAGDPLLMSKAGYQFVALGEMTGQPQCPVFSAGPNGSGLNIEGIDNTADTPTVVLNLVKVG